MGQFDVSKKAVIHNQKVRASCLCHSIKYGYSYVYVLPLSEVKNSTYK